MDNEGQSTEATIYDVARVAGVSPSTVSRTFSRPGRVSAATAQKIRAVAEQLGYRSREVDKAYVKANTKVLGVVVADITNPVNFRMIRGCQSAAAEAGYVVTLADAQESEQLEREMLRRSLPLLDGLVICSSRLSDTELRTIAKNLPTVMLNRQVAGLHSIVPDMAGGVRQALEHLVELGHRTVGYLAGPEASWADGMRWRAMRDNAPTLGLTEHRMKSFAPTMQGGRAAADAVIERKLKAVICYNDVMAIGLIRGLRERGVSVPEQVSIIGHDNIGSGSLIEPGLTTIAAPLTMLGQSAVRYITGVVATGSHAPAGPTVPAVLPAKLVVRGSTAAPR